MIEKTLEVIELEYRWMKRLARLLLLGLMAFPLFQHGPLLWKDGTFNGRWNFAANMEPLPIECRGVPYILQSCDVKFVDRDGGRAISLDYLVFGADWNNALPDIVRSTIGHYSSTIAVSGPGLLARGGALLAMFLLGLCIEKLVMLKVWRFMVARVPVIAPPPPRSNETVILSRDQRDSI